MWSRIVSIVVVLLVVAGAAWALWPRPHEVETATISRGELVVTVEEEGTTRIREVFHVSAPVAGRLTRVTMHVGDAVTEGQTVASILPAGPGLLDERARRMAEAAVEAAEAAVTVAEVNLSQAESQLAFANAELNRTTTLAGRGLVSAQTEQRAALEASARRDGVAAARATLLMRQQELQSARAALIDSSNGGPGVDCCADVRAPASGRVLTVMTESEQIVQPGTPLMDIGDPTDLEIAVDVLSSDAVRLAEGAEATIERWGGDPLRAAISRIAPVATTQVSALGISEQRTRVILEFLDGPEHRARLGHGFRVIARIVLWRGEDVITVPMSALFRQGDAWAVFVADGDRATLRTLTLGQRSETAAEVLDGLDAGDVVILHPPDTVQDGSAIAY